MLNLHSTGTASRIPAPIPGVPESQARALDRRLRLHRQLQSFRRAQRAEPANPSTKLNDLAGPGPA